MVVVLGTHHSRRVKQWMVMAVVVLASACGWTDADSRGASSSPTCANDAHEGCPCRRDKDCDTLWCAAGECAKREP
jgi:hypothetical protein